MTDPRFGYLGFVPRTATERAFARAEEGNAMADHIAKLIDDACLESKAAKVQNDSMNVVPSIQNGETAR